MIRHMTTHAPVHDGGIISQWTIVSGGPAGRPVKGAKPVPDRNVLLTIRQLLPAAKEGGRREVVEARIVLPSTTLRAFLDQLEDHADNVEHPPTLSKSEDGNTGAVPPGASWPDLRADAGLGAPAPGMDVGGPIQVHVDPNPTVRNIAAAEIAHARAAVARLNGVRP